MYKYSDAFVRGFWDTLSNYSSSTKLADIQSIQDYAVPTTISMSAAHLPNLASMVAAEALIQKDTPVDEQRLRKVMGIDPEVKVNYTADHDPTAAYDFTRKTVHVGQEDGSLLAHELGHSKQHKLSLLANMLGRYLAPAGAAITPLLTDRDDAALTRDITTLAGLGTLGNEMGASYRGYKGLRGLGRGRLGALKAFLGVPAYAAAAAAPTIGYEAKDSLDGYTSGDGRGLLSRLQELLGYD